MNNLKTNFGIKDQILPDDYFEINRSGKVFEFRVTALIDKNPAGYRLGVIQIGRIIRKIELCVKNNHSRPQIQFFPNLSENQLVATVYWPEFLGSDFKIETRHVAKINYNVTSIQKLASNYNLSLKKDSDINSINSDSHKQQTFALVSTANQPFIWLKIGQFIEELKITAQGHTAFSLGKINLVTPEKTITQSKEICYSQLIMTIPVN